MNISHDGRLGQGPHQVFVCLFSFLAPQLPAFLRCTTLGRNHRIIPRIGSSVACNLNLKPLTPTKPGFDTCTETSRSVSLRSLHLKEGTASAPSRSATR
ncbi:hypothetical protein BJ508DRAFT_40536 [Ascobolus immersus RN42]|uniref:Uncharacterized protein n=1 Tax=Ascobolus immersus RN42 TaxID=1160509 RepID=A0A3N4HJL4_ASCIM|nr:hypothetical protein BJ508DRAFT_40536 [Ascobolus immersus RN42]